VKGHAGIYAGPNMTGAHESIFIVTFLAERSPQDHLPANGTFGTSVGDKAGAADDLFARGCKYARGRFRYLRPSTQMESQRKVSS